MVIIGAKGFAKEVLEILIQDHCDKEIIFFDDVSTDAPGMLFNQFKLLRSIEELQQYFINVDNAFTLVVGNPTSVKNYMTKLSK